MSGEVERVERAIAGMYESIAYPNPHGDGLCCATCDEKLDECDEDCPGYLLRESWDAIAADIRTEVTVLVAEGGNARDALHRAVLLCEENRIEATARLMANSRLSNGESNGWRMAAAFLARQIRALVPEGSTPPYRVELETIGDFKVRLMVNGFGITSWDPLAMITDEATGAQYAEEVARVLREALALPVRPGEDESHGIWVEAATAETREAHPVPRWATDGGGDGDPLLWGSKKTMETLTRLLFRTEGYRYTVERLSAKR